MCLTACYKNKGYMLSICQKKKKKKDTCYLSFYYFFGSIPFFIGLLFKL
jgi:hypothetical protein